MTEEERFMGPNILQGDWGQTSQFFDFLTVSEKRHSQPPTIDRTEYEDCAVELRSFLSRHRCHLSGEYAVVSQAGFLHSVLESHTGTWLACCQVRDEQSRGSAGHSYHSHVTVGTWHLTGGRGSSKWGFPLGGTDFPHTHNYSSYVLWQMVKLPQRKWKWTSHSSLLPRHTYGWLWR